MKLLFTPGDAGGDARIREGCAGGVSGSELRSTFELDSGSECTSSLST